MKPSGVAAHQRSTIRESGIKLNVEFTSTISKCCAYQPSRSYARSFFGYQCRTKPGSDQLAVPTRIFPSFESIEFLGATPKQESEAPRRGSSVPTRHYFAELSKSHFN